MINIAHRGFESWLEAYWADGDGQMVLDDGMADAFSDWLGEQDQTVIVALAEKWGRELVGTCQECGEQLHLDRKCVNACKGV